VFEAERREGAERGEWRMEVEGKIMRLDLQR
jgi:hypothetical protein